MDTVHSLYSAGCWRIYSSVLPSITLPTKSDHPLKSQHRPCMWDAAHGNRELPSVDYEEYMESDEVLLKMLQKFRQYGLCFIHNTPVSEEATGDALRRIGPPPKISTVVKLVM